MTMILRVLLLVSLMVLVALVVRLLLGLCARLWAALFPQQAQRRQEERQRRGEERRQQEEARRVFEEARQRTEEDPSRPQAPSEKGEGYYGRVLGLKGALTRDDVKRRYRELVTQYHPDRVNDLGPKLRAVAEQEMKAINEAYDYFKKKYDIT
ncbi:MAG: DnaJ domain-containing protein [Lentisphaerae bacterium]|nr:DnaJ domain-containing protein [Lentisphaerota bacterium]